MNYKTQSTSSILMVRPIAFAYNEQTAVSNFFVDQPHSYPEVQPKALREFDELANLLVKNKINVTIAEAQKEPHSPDSIFPNNWISTHDDGTIFLYPMEAPNRRTERSEEVLVQLKEKFSVEKVVDLSFFEQQNLYLEGTGSMVLDRKTKEAYACLSSRTSEKVLQEFCQLSGYRPVTFQSLDTDRRAIYHTNVMMSIGSKFSVVCAESIADQKEREMVLKTLLNSGKESIEISLDQVNHFAGNILELTSTSGEPLIVMSEQAFRSFRPHQLRQLEKQGNILFSPLHTIETVGGGSARCMIAEIFLPLKSSPQSKI